MVAFTGRLGTLNSRTGRIILGLVDSFGVASEGFQVHVLTSRRVRVLFLVKVSENALDPSKYALSSLAPPGTAITPFVNSVRFYDDAHRAVVLELSDQLTWPTNYSLEVTGIITTDGDEIVRFARNFTANVKDPPIAIGAWQSKRGKIDILFDRSVGLTSGAAVFFIRDPSGGPGVAMTQSPWALEGIPNTTLRLDLPGGTPTANSFVIDFAGVTDQSLNVAAGTIPITLALRSSPPYSLADLNQLQIIGAVFTDLASELFKSGTVRVWFNGPTTDADIPVNWAIFQPGAHLWPDTINTVTSPNAFDLASLIILANNIKANFNAHLFYPQIHPQNDGISFITSPVAVDLPTAITLLNEILDKFDNRHLISSTAHLYREFVNRLAVSPIPPFNLATAISVANLLKLKYNTHISVEYPVPFNLSYPLPIGEITDYTKYDVLDKAFVTSGPLTLFVDLHLALEFANEFVIPLRITATILSEDGGSSTNPGNITGNIIALPSVGGFPPEILRHVGGFPAGDPSDGFSGVGTPFPGIVTPEQLIEFSYFGSHLLVPNSVVIVRSPDGELVEIQDVVAGASLPSALWALNDAIIAYSTHINPMSGAVHQAQDTINTIVASDFAKLPLSSIFIAANSLKIKINSHVMSAVFHFQQDQDIIIAPNATDEESLVNLIVDIRRVISEHNVRIGPHSSPGRKMISAPLFDKLKIEPGSMINGEVYSLSGRLRKSFIYNGSAVMFQFVGNRPVIIFIKDLALSGGFIGLATRPSLASAVPRPGLIPTEEGIAFSTDSMDVFFSKPMALLPLDPSRLSVSGGTIIQKETEWVNPEVASMRVARMESIPYAVTAVNLTDRSGNAIY